MLRRCYLWIYGDLYGIFHAIKNPHHCVVRVILLVEAAGIGLMFNLLILNTLFSRLIYLNCTPEFSFWLYNVHSKFNLRGHLTAFVIKV